MTAITDAVDELCAEGPGDILVFLSGEREIRDAEDALTGALGPRVTDPRHPDARYCVGALRFTEAQGIPGAHSLLAQAYGVWHPRELDPQPPIFQGEATLFAHHSAGWPEQQPEENTHD